MIVGMMKMEVLSMTNVNRYTRAGVNGKDIKCPNCCAPATVFHFSWSALTCQYCGKSTNKNSWRIASC